MSEVKEAPTVGSSKPFAIFHGDIEAVEFAVEVSSARWFSARAVGKGRIENARQLLAEDGPFGE